jgi:hypothetical protein
MWLGLIVVGILATANVVVTRRLWRSAAYERGQRIAQTLLIWLVPGGALFVNRVMSADDHYDRSIDPTGPHTSGPQVDWDTPPHDPPIDGHGT